MIVRHILSFISSHGILDIFYPMKLWLPIYTSTILINMIIPLWISHSLLVIGTIQHFYQDCIFPLPVLFGYFSGSILLRKSIVVQKSILGYLGMIHTPLAYYSFYNCHKEYYYYIPCISVYIIIIRSNKIYNILYEMIYNPGIELKDKYEQKLFLGIIHSHILLHLGKYNF